MANEKELQELNQIFAAQIAALKELIAIKDQTITALRTQNIPISIPILQTMCTPFQQPPGAIIITSKDGTGPLPVPGVIGVGVPGQVYTGGGGGASTDFTYGKHYSGVISTGGIQTYSENIRAHKAIRNAI